MLTAHVLVVNKTYFKADIIDIEFLNLKYTLKVSFEDIF